MNIHKITEKFFVSAQIEAADAHAVVDAGIVRVICNRPDQEVPAALQADAIGAAVRAAGIDFAVLPITHQSMTQSVVAEQSELINSADGPVLAYCASGTRSTVIWALGQIGTMPVDEILNQAAQAGYDLSGLRPTLQGLSTND